MVVCCGTYASVRYVFGFIDFSTGLWKMISPWNNFPKFLWGLWKTIAVGPPTPPIWGKNPRKTLYIDLSVTGFLHKLLKMLGDNWAENPAAEPFPTWVFHRPLKTLHPFCAWLRPKSTFPKLSPACFLLVILHDKPPERAHFFLMNLLEFSCNFDGFVLYYRYTIHMV